jgi:hypothetical protein
MKMCAHASPQGGREQTESAARHTLYLDGPAAPICGGLFSMKPIEGYRNTAPSPTYSAASFQVSR